LYEMPNGVDSPLALTAKPPRRRAATGGKHTWPATFCYLAARSMGYSLRARCRRWLEQWGITRVATEI
jgi:hypothetical protein